MHLNHHLTALQFTQDTLDHGSANENKRTIPSYISLTKIKETLFPKAGRELHLA